MNERSVVVRLRVEVADFKRQLNDATRAVEDVGRKSTESAAVASTATGRMVQSAQQNRQAWDTAGRTLVGFGAVTVGALGASAMAAVNWETAWTGVLKTVDGTPEQLDAVEAGLRGLAKVLPSSHDEIAAVAEAAGQLGIKTPDVVGFTKVMIDLGETTNLTADEAATALARISNIMGTASSDVDRMGATIVELGNNAATTEREIVELATRLAAAGRQAGLSEADVFAFSSALTSVGVPAEAAGTAISKVFTSIGDAVRDGGDQLETFAQVSGVSVEEFRRRFEEDAAGAIAMFIDGMGRMSEEGESTTAIFDELSLTDQRLSRAVLSLGSAHGLLTEQLETAGGAWQDNTALLEEAEKRYDTSAAKVAIAKNNIADAAIVLGETFLPAVASAAEGVADLAQWFANLPAPVQQASGMLAGVAGVAGLASGGFLLLFPRVMDTVTAFRQLTPATRGAWRSLGRGAGIAAGVTVGLTALANGIEAVAKSSDRTVTSVEGATKALLAMEDATDIDALFNLGVGADQVSSFDEAVRRLVDPSVMDRMQDFGGSVRGIFAEGTTARTEAIEQFSALGESLAFLVESGHADKAADQFDVLAAAWIEGGGTLEELEALLPAYTDALAGAANEQELAADSQGDLEDAYRITADAVDEQVDSLEALISAQREAAGVVSSQMEAEAAFEAALDGATEAIKVATEADVARADMLDLSTEAGRNNQAALLDIKDAGYEVIESMERNGATQEDLQVSMERTRTKFIATAEAMGMESEEAEALADKLGLIPSEVTTDVNVKTRGAHEQIAALKQRYDGMTLGQMYFDIKARNQFTAAQAASAARYTGLASQYAQGGPVRRYATAGAVFGPGTETSDSIPALLSNNEHVWSAAEVKGAGGHAAVAELRAAALFGGLPGTSVARFADGGSPVWTAGAAASLQGGPPSKTLIYHAAPNQSLSSEEQLWAAAGRARMVGW